MKNKLLSLSHIFKSNNFNQINNFYNTSKYFFANAAAAPSKKSAPGKIQNNSNVEQEIKNKIPTPGTSDIYKDVTFDGKFREYKPFEKFTIKDMNDRMEDFKKESYYYYGSMKRRAAPKRFNKTEFFAKQLRQMWIRSGDFSLNKHVIEIKRLRKREDTIFGLLKQGEMAAVIEGREEFPEINFVVDKKFSKHLDR
jgi:hypothetical protein